MWWSVKVAHASLDEHFLYFQLWFIYERLFEEHRLLEQARMHLLAG